jgi:hypothetical protein
MLQDVGDALSTSMNTIRFLQPLQRHVENIGLATDFVQLQHHCRYEVVLSTQPSCSRIAGRFDNLQLPVQVDVACACPELA